MRLLVVLGTRPEIIKLGPVCQALARYPDVQTDIFWTGQHIELAAGLLDWFNIKATYSNDDIVDLPGLGSKFSRMMENTEALFRQHKYDWIVVQGDTATAAAAATVGFLNKVPVAHVEAGLRTGNLYSPWPEEFNRRLITVATNLHFAPTRRAAANLRAEGVPEAGIFVVGNTVVDALLFTRERVGASSYRPIEPALSALPHDKKLVLVTLHRRENIGAKMLAILKALRTLAEDGDKLVVLPLHLNPDVRRAVLSVLGATPNARLLPPLQYPDFVHLLNRAWVAVSDSGGVQEEAPAFGLRVLITRDTTERPEVVEAGFGQLVGDDPERIIAGVRALTKGEHRQLHNALNPFGTGDAGERIAAALLARSPNTGAKSRIGETVL